MTIAPKLPRQPRNRVANHAEADRDPGIAHARGLRLQARPAPAPIGNAGPLVTSLAGFREYHRQSSAVWERQALVRARVTTGDRELGAKWKRRARNSCTARTDGSRGRGNCRDAPSDGDGDRSRGQDAAQHQAGSRRLVDVEFLVQMMALSHGHRHPELRVRDTMGLLEALDGLHLLSAADASILEDDYRFLSRWKTASASRAPAVMAVPTSVLDAAAGASHGLRRCRWRRANARRTVGASR